MHNKFISVVILLKSEYLKNVNPFLIKVHKILKNKFSHFEIILVNNCVHPDIRELTNELSQKVKKDIAVINLSIKTNEDNAIIAGFDKTNGDYTMVLDLNFPDNSDHIVNLFELSQNNYDIVYLKYKNRYLPKSKIIFYKLFYYLMNKYSGYKTDINIHESRIISRRALNAILSIRENIRYMKGIYSIVGYKTKSIEVDIPPHESENYKKQFKSFIIAITSFTGLLSSLFLWIFFTSIIFIIFVSVNAIKVKYSSYDILGNYIGALPVGWTFTILFLSIIFTAISFMLYLISIYLDNIYKEVKHRPIYIIESFQRL
jgi:dolichol-phosphate mannosyltransferase